MGSPTALTRNMSPFLLSSQVLFLCLAVREKGIHCYLKSALQCLSCKDVKEWLHQSVSLSHSQMLLNVSIFFSSCVNRVDHPLTHTTCKFFPHYQGVSGIIMIMS